MDKYYHVDPTSTNGLHFSKNGCIAEDNYDFKMGEMSSKFDFDEMTSFNMGTY